MSTFLSWKWFVFHHSDKARPSCVTPRLCLFFPRHLFHFNFLSINFLSWRTFQLKFTSILTTPRRNVHQVRMADVSIFLEGWQRMIFMWFHRRRDQHSHKITFDVYRSSLWILFRSRQSMCLASISQHILVFHFRVPDQTVYTSSIYELTIKVEITLVITWIELLCVVKYVVEKSSR